ncbi:hypothetical protein Pla123a_39690 [Posidoniimonas polymericola]|uniref:Transposase IS30-like HTH domain-containing protein n=1 Tax=Posidoniimonas polymericola TaxID=2528002 RepID=A0A5C5YD13_9BACT|nr:hypothetical protein [Posidoniimonas polymericola]TWT72673.1 hypothetical protein Pla123a_39690 [Posidoniimonas polymericola]
MGRPRVLDEGKQREVCALLTAGMTVGEAADYVGCCVKTIRREQARDDDFDERVRRARMAARLGPLQAVRQAAATHWRAAAWLVDRQDRQEERERRARCEQAKLKQQRAKAKPKQPPQPWDLERQIQQIASARPPHQEPPADPKRPRRQPGEPTTTAARPAKDRRSPVAAALKELAEQIAASARRERQRGTKPELGPAPEPAVEPAVEDSNAGGGVSNAEGFVPSLRVFGQNDEDAMRQVRGLASVVPSAKPAAAAEGCCLKHAMSPRREPGEC